MIDYTDVTYLSKGSAKQQFIYNLIIEHQLLTILKDYQPVLVGTFPLDIQVDQSDIDIICEVYDRNVFAELMTFSFAGYPSFELRDVQLDVPATLCSFVLEGVPVEIFAQPLPVVQQMGYRHLEIEAKILSYFGTAFKEEIIKLKQEGLKTEPAFCRLLHIKGDPYLGLLKLLDVMP